MTTIPQMPVYLQPQPVPDQPGLYEYISEAGELSARELKTLNAHGYLYHSEVNDVDFDYEDQHGTQHTGYQDIYYFTRVPVNHVD